MPVINADGCAIHVAIEAAHISNIEQPAQFNGAVLEFLTRSPVRP